MPLRKNLYEAPNYTFVAPQVQISDEIKAKLTEEGIRHLQTLCLDDYAKAQQLLNQAIGEVLEYDPVVVKTARKLATRLVQLIEADVELREQDKGQTNPLKIELAKLSTLSKTITQSEDRKVEYGNLNEYGFFGISPLSIKNVLKNGNLRELMYIVYRTSRWGYYTAGLLKDDARMLRINPLLREHHGWEVDMGFVQEVLQDQIDHGVPKDETTIYRFASERQNAPQRILRTEEEKAEAAHRFFRRTAKDKLLSPREASSMGLGFQCDKVDYHDKPVTWLPGAVRWIIKDMTHPFTLAARATCQPILSGVSGGTDDIMTQAHFLGLGSQADLILCRLVCLGYLISGDHHSVDEVLTATKSYRLPYTAGPKGYLDIYPGNTTFIEKLEKHLREKNSFLPDYYLTQENVQKYINEGSLSAFYVLHAPSSMDKTMTPGYRKIRACEVRELKIEAQAFRQSADKWIQRRCRR